jgi:predicted NBD/HSP70 family sugar kinase
MRINDQEANRLRVLKAIRRAEPVARTELAELTGLPIQTLSDVVADLLGRDLLVEDKAPVNGRGRPRVLIRLNAGAARVAGACLFPDGTFEVEIADLRGSRLFGRSFKLHYTGPVDGLTARIAAHVEETMAASPFAMTEIHSLGLAVPAIVDSVSGVLHWLPGYPPEPSPLAERLGEQLGLPVFIDSVADVLTRAEHWFGEDRQVDDFSLIFVGLGIGLGQYQDGTLRTGSHGICPAFAHVKVAPGQGPACMCGAQGCLVTFASMSGVIGRISERRGVSPPRLEQMQEVFDAFARDAQAGDAEARDVFEFAGIALGTATANYINLMDPARLIVVLLDATFSALIAQPFEAALGANTLSVLRGRVPIEFRASDVVAFSKGTAALVLEKLYRNGGVSGRG